MKSLLCLTTVLTTDEDIGGVHSMQSRYSAKMMPKYECNMQWDYAWKRGESIVLKCVDRNPRIHRVCRLSITMVEEAVGIKKSLE